MAQHIDGTIQNWRLASRRLPIFRKHWRLVVAAAAFLTVAAAFLHSGFFSARPAVVPAPYPHQIAQVSFAVAGDVIPHEAVRAAAAAQGSDAQGWIALFSDVADVFRSVDFGFVNMETPVAPAHSKGSKPFMFDAPVALPEALKASGIKIVSFANNHVMDQGWPGFTETREHLREVGLFFSGTGDTAAQSWQPVIVEANGIKVGWLGMTRWLNGNRNPEIRTTNRTSTSIPIRANPGALRARTKPRFSLPSKPPARSPTSSSSPSTGALSTPPRPALKTSTSPIRCSTPVPRSSWATIPTSCSPLKPTTPPTAAKHRHLLFARQRTYFGGPNAYGLPSLSQFEISSQPGTTLECSLDGAAFRPCSTLVRLAMLPLGGHSLHVRQVDEAGNTSPAATYHWVVLRRRGPRGLPRAATLLVARNATAAGARTLQVGCDLNAGSVRRCRVLAFYHGTQVGQGVAWPAHRGHMHSIVTVALNARGRALLGQALGGLPVKLVGYVKPFGFGVLPARNSTVITAPLRFLLPDVLFDFDSWQLTPTASQIVREMAGQLRGARTVVCQGNTDSYGARAYNYWLGLARAETVCATLQALGVHAQMSSFSDGAERPVASNATTDGRHLNRRVLVRVSYYDLPRKRRTHSLAATLKLSATTSF